MKWVTSSWTVLFDFMSSNEAPKKISADHVEVLAADGHTIQEAKDHSSSPNGFFSGNGAQVRVIRGGPAMLLLAPILIPLLIIGFFLLAIFALFFGRTLFKTAFGRMTRTR